MSSGLHFYAWFPGDYARDTAHLSMVEDAAYRRLLDAYYMSGRVSANADVLPRVCRAITPDEQAAVQRVVAEFFEVRNGYLYHDKVEHELARSRAISSKRADAGRRGAEKTNGKRSANADTNVATSDAASDAAIVHQPIPTINSVEGKPSTGASAPPAFSEPDPIFGHCLTFLTAKGCAAKGARSFLGLMRKNHGDAALMQAVERAEREDISEPIPWLRKYLESRPKETVGAKPEAWMEGLL